MVYWLLVNHLIEQYTIAATPKYNFPHPGMDTLLPQRFVEQCIHSLKHVRKGPFQLNQQDFQQPDSLDVHSFRLKMQPIPLKPRRAETAVAACDTSTMRIGETSTGMLIAVRGANVWKQGRCYRYSRLGPFLFHITEENKREVYNTLESAYFGSVHEQNGHGFLNLAQMPTRIAGLLERWLQTTLVRTVSSGIVLFDGSLVAGTSDNPISRVRGILSHASRRGSVVLAFSKMTSLRVNGFLITDLCAEHRAPCLVETAGLKSKAPVALLGDVYVARLAHGKYSFRLDISKDVPVEERVAAVEKLLGNDALLQGYPETLRLAHILCTFTANEVIAMQHFAVRKFGLRIINRPDMHKVLFGVFGGGEICS
jgi:hypothetical protein